MFLVDIDEIQLDFDVDDGCDADESVERMYV